MLSLATATHKIYADYYITQLFNQFNEAVQITRDHIMDKASDDHNSMTERSYSRAEIKQKVKKTIESGRFTHARVIMKTKRLKDHLYKRRHGVRISIT